MITIMLLQRGRKSGAEGAAAPPPPLEKGDIAPYFFARDDNFLSTTMPLHM